MKTSANHQNTLSIIMSDTTQTLLDQLKDDGVMVNVDDLLDGLKTNDDIDDTNVPAISAVELKEEDINKFILSHSARLIEDSTSLVSRLKKTVGASGDAEEVSALADMIASASAAIESLNKISLQNKKIQAAKDLKNLEIEGKKEVARIKLEEVSKPKGLLVANREEIFQLLLQGKNRPEQLVIDVPSS